MKLTSQDFMALGILCTMLILWLNLFTKRKNERSGVFQIIILIVALIFGYKYFVSIINVGFSLGGDFKIV